MNLKFAPFLYYGLSGLRKSPSGPQAAPGPHVGPPWWRCVLWCLFADRTGRAVGSGARGAGPARRHGGAGETRPRVGHEDCSERGRAHQRGQPGRRGPAQVDAADTRRRMHNACPGRPERAKVTDLFLLLCFLQRWLLFRSSCLFILSQTHVRYLNRWN